MIQTRSVPLFSQPIDYLPFQTEIYTTLYGRKYRLFVLYAAARFCWCLQMPRHSPLIVHNHCVKPLAKFSISWSFLPDNFSPLSLRCEARGYLADNLDGGWVGAWAQPGPGDTVGGGRGGHPPSLSLLSPPSPTSGAPDPQGVCLWPSAKGGAHCLLPTVPHRTLLI